MARPVWTGVISFGLVAVPVAMHPATQEHDVSFHQFQKGTRDRIRYQRVNERTGAEVHYADIVKGADIGGGGYVLLDPEELDAIAPGRSRSLDIHAFVDLAEIDPLFFQKTYFLAPGSDETVKTYALLRAAMADTGRAAIGTLVMRSREYLAAIRADGDLLVLETMFFADEVRDPHQSLDRLPGDVHLRRREITMAAQLIDSMTTPWLPQDYRDTYTGRVQDLIAAKAAGRDATVAEEAPAATNVVDLMDVLRRSVDQARARRATNTTRTPAAAARGKARGSTTLRTTADLRGLTKSALVGLARDLAIPGRSTMTRAQLEKAVAGAQSTRRA